jgi:hypothetical protein
MTEEPRYTKPEDFFDEVTREIQLSPPTVKPGQEIKEEDPPKEENTAVHAAPVVDAAELPTQIAISIIPSAPTPPPPPAAQLPVKPPVTDPPIPYEEKTPTPEFTRSGSFPSITQVGPKANMPDDLDFADEFKKPTQLKALSDEFNLGQVWHEQRNTILIMIMLVAAGVGFLILRNHRKAEESVDIADSPTEAQSGSWSMNLERPLFEIHSETKTWADLESQFDSAAKDLENQK